MPLALAPAFVEGREQPAGVAVIGTAERLSGSGTTGSGAEPSELARKTFSYYSLGGSWRIYRSELKT